MKRTFPLLLAALLLALLPSAGLADILVDFEGFTDGQLLTNQIPGLNFAGVEVITAGISLNEFEAPPHSGSSVGFALSGGIHLDLAIPATAVRAFFTYMNPVVIRAYDAAWNPVANASSAFSNNLALSGDTGSSPNELLSVEYAGGMTHLIFTAGADPGQFVMDDLFVAAVPEPASWLLIGTGLLFGALVRLSRR